MATSVYVNNVSTAVPGVYSTTDASGLAQAGLSASGIVALLGTATGGRPYTAAAGDPGNLPRLGNPQALQKMFAEGDLREAGAMLFDPSSDPNVRGGAQIVIAVQVNQAVQATVTLPGSGQSNGSPSVKLTALAYGQRGNSISANVSLQDNVDGVLVTIRDEASGAVEAKGGLTSAAAVVAWINANSQLVQAAPAGDTPPTPSPTSTPLQLSAGLDKPATFSDWQAALNLLKSLRVNTVVALSSDPAVAAALEAHCAYMCGQGRSERNGYVGVAGTDGALPTKAQIKQATLALNSRHVAALGQSLGRFDSAGQNRLFPTYFTGAVAAGMQAGAGLGEPQTFKYIKATTVQQARDWSPVDDADELIQAGSMIAQRIDGKGIRWVRGVTTYQSDDNLAFTEISVNASVNYVAYTVRDNLEFAVGRPGFAGTVNAVKSIANDALSKLVQAKVIASYDAITVTPVADRFEVAFNIVPALPVNFVVVNLHLQFSRSGADTNTAAAA